MKTNSPLETLPSGTPFNPDPSAQAKPGQSRMNIDISPRKPGEKILYTGPHLCLTCAQENRITNVYLKAGETAPSCKACGTRASWQP